MMNKPVHSSPTGCKERRGGATIAALIAVMVVFALCMGLLQVTSGVSKRLRSSVDHKQAFQLAEAGLAEAYTGLAIGKTGNVGSPEAPAAIGNGLFWVEATELGSDIVSLESTGMKGRGRITLGLAVRRVRVNLASLGLFSSQDFVVQGNTFLDSYDSSVGTYGEHVAAQTNKKAVIGSNGDVSVGSGSSVLGDIAYGANGQANLANGAVVTGTMQPRPAAVPLPAVEVPTIPLAPAITSRGIEPLVVPPGEVGYESFTVARGTQAVLTGPLTAVTGDFTVESKASLSFDNSAGPIDIFVTGDLDLQVGSTVATVTDDPDMVSIQVASDSTHSAFFGAQALFYGQVYAPSATVEVLPDFGLFGNLAANLIDISAQAKMHYDLNTLPTRREVLPTMWAWQVVDVPDSVASNGADPFRVLGVNRNALPSPAKAHEDQLLSLSYIDLLGATVTFDGWESTFDWTQVAEVLSCSRDGTVINTLPKGGTPTTKPKTTYTAAEQVIVDLIQSPATSADVSAALIAKYPASENLLLEAINRVPAMNSRDLFNVLAEYGPNIPGFPEGKASGPASDTILMAAIAQPGFASKELSWLLEQSSPLKPSVLDAAINRTPAMKTPHLNTVLGAQ